MYNNYILYSSLALIARASSYRNRPKSLRLASILSPSSTISVMTCSDRLTCSLPTITHTFPSGFCTSFFTSPSFPLTNVARRERSSLLISLMVSSVATRPLLSALAISKDTVAAVFRSIEQSDGRRRPVETALHSSSNCESVSVGAGAI
ncbi:hypothetical protein PFISCL1PPCAC_11292, partial [Pristionchus fissidentatus]